MIIKRVKLIGRDLYKWLLFAKSDQTVTNSRYKQIAFI